MASAKVIILEYIIPSMGIVTAFSMNAAPIRALQRAIKSGTTMGDLNPTPWAFMLGQSLGWVTYGIIKQDPFMFFGSCPGFIVSIWLNLGAVKVLYQGTRYQQMTSTVEQQLAKSSMNIFSAEPITKEQMLYLQKLMDEQKEDESIEYHSDNDEDSTTDIENGSYQDEANNVKGKLQKLASSMMNIIPSGNKNSKTHGGTRRRSVAFRKDDDSMIDHPNIEEANSSKQTLKTPKIHHEILVLTIASIWIICISTITMIPSISPEKDELIVAILANINMIFFYGAPLSTIYQVIKEKNSSTIHVPTMIMNTVNASLWTTYGFVILDPFSILPNALGVIFGSFQLFLCIIFPREETLQKSFAEIVEISAESFRKSVTASVYSSIRKSAKVS